MLCQIKKTTITSSSIIFKDIAGAISLLLLLYVTLHLPTLVANVHAF